MKVTRPELIPYKIGALYSAASGEPVSIIDSLGARTACYVRLQYEANVWSDNWPTTESLAEARAGSEFETNHDEIRTSTYLRFGL